MIAVAGKCVRDVGLDLLLAPALPAQLMSSPFYTAWKEFRREIGSIVSRGIFRDKAIERASSGMKGAAYITSAFDSTVMLLDDVPFPSGSGLCGAFFVQLIVPGIGAGPPITAVAYCDTAGVHPDACRFVCE